MRSLSECCGPWRPGVLGPATQCPPLALGRAVLVPVSCPGRAGGTCHPGTSLGPHPGNQVGLVVTFGSPTSELPT